MLTVFLQVFRTLFVLPEKAKLTEECSKYTISPKNIFLN